MKNVIFFFVSLIILLGSIVLIAVPIGYLVSLRLDERISAFVFGFCGLVSIAIAYFLIKKLGEKMGIEKDFLNKILNGLR
jgi:uncharacterized membrane protein YqgA involved in biofilm formation